MTRHDIQQAKPQYKSYRRKTRITIDAADKVILRQLRVDARVSNAQLGQLLGLSTPTIWRRKRRLERLGRLRVIAVDPHAARSAKQPRLPIRRAPLTNRDGYLTTAGLIAKLGEIDPSGGRRVVALDEWWFALSRVFIAHDGSGDVCLSYD